jgi:ferredoxin
VRGHPGNEIAPNAQGHKLIETAVVLPDGITVSLKAPVLDLDLCIGYGICKTRCPVVDGPAICCTSVGETRSENYRLLLDVLMQG